MSDVNIGNRQSAASPTIYLHPAGDAVQIEMHVRDNQLRRLGVDYDGLEVPFALVPIGDKWVRYDLGYGGTYSSRGSSEIADRFNLTLHTGTDGIDVDQIKRQGIAFGMEVNGSSGHKTVWLQSPNENYKPIY